MGAVCNTTSSIANAHSAIDELNAIPKLVHAIGAQWLPFSAPEEMTGSKRRDICKWVRRKLGLWPRGMWRVFPLFPVESFENCRLVGVSVGSFVGLFVDAVGRLISSLWVELYGDCSYWNMEYSEMVKKWNGEMELTSPVGLFYVDRRHQLAYHPWVYIRA